MWLQSRADYEWNPLRTEDKKENKEWFSTEFNPIVRSVVLIAKINVNKRSVFHEIMKWFLSPNPKQIVTWTTLTYTFKPASLLRACENRHYSPLTTARFYLLSCAATYTFYVQLAGQAHGFIESMASNIFGFCFAQDMFSRQSRQHCFLPLLCEQCRRNIASFKACRNGLVTSMCSHCVTNTYNILTVRQHVISKDYNSIAIHSVLCPALLKYS